MGIISLLVIGLIAGAVARLLIPGRDQLGVAGTLILGVVGSLIGGLIAVALTDRTMDELSASGVLGSILGAMVALVVYRFLQPRGFISGRRGARL